MGTRESFPFLLLPHENAPAARQHPEAELRDTAGALALDLPALRAVKNNFYPLEISVL